MKYKNSDMGGKKRKKQLRYVGFLTEMAGYLFWNTRSETNLFLSLSAYNLAQCLGAQLGLE